MLEELFLNTVKHGHRGGSDAPIWITLAASDGEVSLTYEDFARRLSTRSRAPRARCWRRWPRRAAKEGLGVILAHGLTATADYSYLFGRNRIRLTLA